MPVELRITIPTNDLESTWRELYEFSVNKPVFYQYSFISILNNILTGGKIELAILVEGEDWVAALPLRVHENYAENLTHPGWDHLNMLSRDSTYQLKLLVAMKERYGHLILRNFCELPLSSITGPYFKEGGFKCPHLPLGGKEFNVLQKVSPSFKKTIKRKLSIFKKQGGEVKFFDKHLTENDLQEIQDLHSQRFADKSQVSSFLNPNVSKFHQALFSNNPANILISKAFIGGQVVGVFYGFFNSESYYYFNSGINPNFNHLSLGVILMYRTIEEAKRRGALYFEFLRGQEPYKFHWTKILKKNFTYYIQGRNSWLSLCWLYWNEMRKRMGGKKTILHLIRKRVK